MANYSLVLDTKFNPFSYAEMLAPVAAATQAHQALEEEYGNLSAKADVWENMANEQSDPLAYKMYKGYSDDLRDRADTLLREGLNASSRKGMLDMRARYSKEIAPIEIAYKRREELAAEQRKAYAANPTLRYERYANAMSLDDFIKNPSIDYGRSYSGALLTQQVAQAAANYAKVLTREGKLKSLGLPFQYTKDLGRGATPEQVLAVINKAAQNGEEGAISFLRSIRDQVIAASGTNDWITPGSAAAQERDAFANMGLYSALGQTEIKDYTDTYSMNNALAIAKEERAARAAAKLQEQNKLAINPLNIYSNRELNKEESIYNTNINAYKKYFYRDEQGRWRMTWDGKKEYERRVTTPTYIKGPDGYVILESSSNGSGHTDFRKFMDSIGVSSDDVINNRRGIVGNVWARYLKNAPASKTARYDATKVTEFDYNIARSQQDSMKDAIIEASKGLPLQEVDYDSKSKMFKPTGSTLSMKDFSDETKKYRVLSTRFSAYGKSIMVADSEGNITRYKLPKGINTTNEQNQMKALTAAANYQEIINTGQYTDKAGKVHKATDEERQLAQEAYEQTIQNAYLYESQLLLENKTDEQKFNPYGY